MQHYLIITAVCCLAGGDWPMRRHDPILSGRTSTPGRLREAPHRLWSFQDDVLDVELELTAEDEAPGSGVRINPSKLAASPESTDRAQPGGTKKRRKQADAPLVDLRGDGRLVPDPGKAAALIPGVKGLQTVTFEPVAGAEATLARRAVCYAHDQVAPRVAWTSEAFDTVQNTNHIVADVDGDGQLEVVLAPHYRVIILDGATGRTEHVLRFHDFRNYGFFCAANLDQDPQLELIVIGDFVLHVDVIDMDDRGPRLLWRQDIEEDIQSKRRILRPGPDPVCDLDGDGRKEIVFNLYSDAKDSLWHVVALDALTGDRKLDLPGRYLEGHDDLDGDGKEELLVTVCPALYVPRAGTIEVVAWRPAQTPPLATLWSFTGARFLPFDSQLPLTHSTIVARGSETASVVDTKSERSKAFAVANVDAGREILRVLELGRDRPLVEASFPAGRSLSVRGVQDGGADCPPALRVLLRARTKEEIELPAPKGGRARPLAARPVNARTARGSNSDGWVSVGAWDHHPAVFAENALDEVMAVRPGPDGAAQVVWRDRGHGPVVLADVDGDGTDEAVFGDESPNGEGRIVAAGPAGRKWARAIDGFPGPNPTWNYGGVTQWWAGKFTSRDRSDIFVSARRGTMHSDEGFVLRGEDGSILWHRSEVRTPNMAATTRGWGCGGGPLNTLDVDGDGLDDVLSLYPVNYWVSKGSTGEVLRSVDAASGLFNGVWGAYATPCATDLDGDGKRELLWSGPYHQGVTDLDGKVRWFTKGATGVATVCDLNADGRLEVASTGWESGGKGLRVVDARTGELRWELPLEGNPRVPMTAAQLDGEGGEDLLFAAGKSLRAVTLRDGALRELWAVPIPSEPLGEVAFADADGDGFGEALFVGQDGVLYCFGNAAGERGK